MGLGHLRKSNPRVTVDEPRMDVTAVPSESDEDEHGGTGTQSSGDAEQHPHGGDGELIWTSGHFAAFALPSISHVPLLVGRRVDANVGKTKEDVRIHWFPHDGRCHTYRRS